MKPSDLSIIDLLDFSPDRGLLGLDNRRVMIFDGNILMELRRMLVQIMGWKRCKPVIFQYGHLIGRLDAENLGRVYGWPDKVEWLRAGPIMQTQRGLAKAVFTDCSYDMEQNKLRFEGHWYNSYEVDSHKHLKLTGDETVCYVLCGYLSGFASVCFDREVLVIERSCFPRQAPCTFEGRFLPDWGDEEGSDIMENARQYDLRSKYEHLDKELAKSHREIMVPENDTLPFKQIVREHPEWLPGQSTGMSKVLEMVNRVAKTNANILLTGGTGVGKEVVANYIHAISPRASASFLAINCTTLPETLLESELFGHVKGSFTGAQRDKKGLLIEAGEGTIFLDEIGDVPLSIQVKLLRALQEKKIRPVGGSTELPVKARLITSTNRDLKQMMAEGNFRSDLYYRLNVFPIHIPDLKDRREDILPIARYILGKTGSGSLGFSPQVAAALEAYDWPGNVRELENTIEYASIVAGKDKIRLEHLPAAITHNRAELDAQVAQAHWPSLHELEEQYILRVLEFCGGKKAQAAKLLGIGNNTLWRKLKK